MMQSILLAKPSSSVNAESAQGSVKDNQLKDINDDILTEQLPSNKFSGVLGEAIELPEKMELKANAIAAQLLSKIALNEEGEVNTTTVTDSQVSGKDVQLASDLSTNKQPLSQNNNDKNLILPQSSSHLTETSENADSSNIIDQIQAAQNIDTNLSATVKGVENNPQKNSVLNLNNIDIKLPFKPTAIASSVVNENNQAPLNTLEINPTTNIGEQQLIAQDKNDMNGEYTELDDNGVIVSKVTSLQPQSVSPGGPTNAKVAGSIKNNESDLIEADSIATVTAPVINTIQDEQADLKEFYSLTSSPTPEVSAELITNGQVVNTNLPVTESVDDVDVDDMNSDKIAQLTVTKPNNHTSKSIGGETVNNINNTPESIETSIKTEKIKSPDLMTATPTIEKQMEGLMPKHTELEKTPVNHFGDGLSGRVSDINSASLNKVEHQPIQSTPTQTALQQSLDLHAKHSAALISERVLMMINQGKQEIHIRLDPAELGSMHIKLHIQQDQLNMSIQTDVSQSKDIIEQNLPKLREQLAQQGINLGNTNIEQNSRGQQQNQQNANQQGQSSTQHRSNISTGDNSSSGNDDGIIAGTIKIPLSEQGIDYYA